MLACDPMLSRYARFAQLLELTLYGVAGAWLYQVHGWSMAAIVALALANAFAVRLAIVATSIALGYRHRSPRDEANQLDARGTWRYLVGECRAWFVFNLVAVPWDRWWVRPDPPPTLTERVPVLLVHGYFSNRGYFRALVRALEAHGAGPVYTPNFRTWFASIEALEEEIHRAIEGITAATGQPRVFVVAHSMGGLGMRAYLVRRGAAKVAGLVTLATPHAGTALARFGSGENARQMRRGSVFLGELVRMEEMAPHPPTSSIWSCHDNLVAPQESSRLPWARNECVPGFGHISLLDAPEVHARVFAAMREAGALPGA